MRKFNDMLFWWIIIGLVVGALYMHRHHKAIKVPTAGQICTAKAPCIQLNGGNGHKIATFNDFRFVSNSCIAYRMTVQETFQQYCGPYDLQWIGPNNVKELRI